MAQDSARKATIKYLVGFITSDSHFIKPPNGNAGSRLKVELSRLIDGHDGRQADLDQLHAQLAKHGYTAIEFVYAKLSRDGWKRLNGIKFVDRDGFNKVLPLHANGQVRIITLRAKLPLPTMSSKNPL